MSITNYLNKIKTAVYGRDVRSAIHDAIKECYDDASVNHNNANMEVKLARGFHNTLNERLDNSEQKLDKTNDQIADLSLNKADKTTMWGMANMAQDVKEALLVPGTSIPVVDKGCVVEESIVSQQVAPHHTSFIKVKSVNQFDKSRYVSGFLNNKGGINSSSDYLTTHYIPVLGNVPITISSNARIYNLYDSNYSLLTNGFYDFGETTSKATTFVPDQTGYLRVSFAKGALNNYQVSFTDTLVPYTQYELETSIKHLSGVDEIEFINRKLMCFNKDDENNTIGFIGTNGTITTGDSASTYSTTHFIPINQGEHIYINKSRKVGLYLQDKTFYAMVSDTNETDYTFESPVTGFLRVSVQTSAFATLIIAIKDSAFVVPYPTINSVGGYGWELEQYIKPHPKTIGFEELADDVIKVIGDAAKMTGKVVLNLGDSIAAGDGNNYKGYAHLIAEKNNCILHSYAKGGATIGNRESVSGNLNILHQVASALSDGVQPDYIFLNGGTNDISGNAVELGTITEDGNYSVTTADTSTFCGALETIFSQLRNAYPSAKIVYIRVHKMNTRDIAKQIEYGDKAAEICNKWSIPVADIFNKGQLNTFLPCMFQYTNPTEAAPHGDRTHPNQEGYLNFYLPVIENLIDSI